MSSNWDNYDKSISSFPTEGVGPVGPGGPGAGDVGVGPQGAGTGKTGGQPAPFDVNQGSQAGAAPGGVIGREGQVVSPMKLAEMQNQAVGANTTNVQSSLDTTMSQMKNRINLDQANLSVPSNMDKLNNQPPAYHKQMNSRMQGFQDYMQQVHDKLGMEYQAPPKQAATGESPASYFLSLLTNAQDQINSVGTQLKNKMKPGESQPMQMKDLMTVQWHMNTANQQLTLFSNMLNKVIESIKTVMNTQV